MKKFWFGIVAVSALLLSILPTNASSIQWTLVGVTFADGGTASGTFSVDSTTGVANAWDITTTAGTTLSGTIYDMTTSLCSCVNPIVVDVGFPNFVSSLNQNFLDPNLELVFADPLNLAGVDPLVPGSLSSTGGSFECAGPAPFNCLSSIRFVTGGEAVSGTTPLPAALPLFATGLGALGLLGWRRKRKVRAVA